MKARGYVIVVLVLAAASCGAVVAFNARVDPYGLAAVPDRTNLAPDAPRPGAFFRKVLTVREAMPRTIVLGTSRAEFGIDPRAPGFTAEYAPVLNVALGGLSIEQMRLVLIHANAVSPLRLAVIGLDLESFLDAGRTDFDPAALEGNAESEPPLLVRLRLAMSARCAGGQSRARERGPIGCCSGRAGRCDGRTSTRTQLAHHRSRASVVGWSARPDLGGRVRQLLLAHEVVLSGRIHRFAVGGRSAAARGDGIVQATAALRSEPRN
jgi:hypothetical protein